MNESRESNGTPKRNGVRNAAVNDIRSDMVVVGMPVVLFTSGKHISTSDVLTDNRVSSSASEHFDNNAHSALLVLIRQLTDVAQLAEYVVQRVFVDISQVFAKTQQLQCRLDRLQIEADQLLNWKPPKITSGGEISRYTNVKEHYRSEIVKHIDTNDENTLEPLDLFDSSTRPFPIMAFYGMADENKLRKRPSTETCSTQTDYSGRILRSVSGDSPGDVVDDDRSPPLFAPPKFDESKRLAMSYEDEYVNGFCQLEHSTRTPATPGDTGIVADLLRQGKTTERRRKSESQFPSSNMLSSSSSSSGVALLVPVDTSGAPIRRLSSARKQRTIIDNESPTTIDRSPTPPPPPPPVTPSSSENNTTTNRGKSHLQSRRNRRCARRNTIVGCEQLTVEDRSKNDDDAQQQQQQQQSQQQQSAQMTDVLGSSQIRPEMMVNQQTSETDVKPATTGDSLQNDVLYDFAPFYRRRTTLNGLKSSANFFFSLRRQKKDKSSSSSQKSDQQQQQQPHHLSSERLSTPQKSSPITGVKSLKDLFYRSVSLRKSSSNKHHNNNGESDPVYENINRRPITEKKHASTAYDDDGGSGSSMLDSKTRSLSTSSSKSPKSILPISTSSQVITLASLLRHDGDENGVRNDRHSSKVSSSSSRDSAYSSCGKKLRQPSLISLSSNNSLDFSDNKVSGWYRQGYKMDYPEECVYNLDDGKIHVKDSGIAPANVCDQHKIDKSILSSPLSDDSSFVESNFSCDKEGYFTTMHHDCGLEPKQQLQGTDRRRPPVILSVGTAKKGRSFSTHSSASTIAEGSSTFDECSTPKSDCLPPMSDILDISNTADGQSHLRQLTTAAYLSGMTLSDGNSLTPTSPGNSEADVKFDLWLMSKFHAEQRLRQYGQQNHSVTDEQFLAPLAHVPQSETVSSNNRASRFFSRSFGRFSLPRNAKSKIWSENNCNGYTRNVNNGHLNERRKELINGSNGSPPQLLNQASLPRKTVRFCD